MADKDHIEKIGRFIGSMGKEILTVVVIATVRTVYKTHLESKIYDAVDRKLKARKRQIGFRIEP